MGTPPNGWQDPKTDWQAPDVPLSGDFNRIEGNINAIEQGNRTIDPAQAPTSNVGTLRQFLDWFANRIKAITGKTNWWEAPATTLENVSAHISAEGSVHFVFAGDAPYSGTALERTNLSTDNGVWRSVGPTGSNADIIWPALDAVPNGAKGVRLNLAGWANHWSAANGEHYIKAAFRKVGSTFSPGAEFLKYAFYAYAYLTNEFSSERNTIDVPLDEYRRFEFYWDKVVVSGGTLGISVYLAGWYL